MNVLDKFQNSLDQTVEQITQYLQRLSPRERIMVIFTSIFLVIVMIGGALWKMHALAEQEQKRVNQLKDLLVWMQSHAVTMQPASDSQLSPAEKIQRVAQQQSLSVSVQQNNEQIQLVAQHQNYAILANFLMQLAQMGLSIEKMEFVTQENQIKLTATVQ